MASLTGHTVSHYRILEKLGEGGMGVVYKGEDLKLTRTVALKFLPHGLDAHEPERARFLQEARAAAVLNHPNICTVYDIQEHEGQQFIVMEYLEGKTLRKAIEDARLPGGRQEGGQGRLNIEDGIKYAIQIGEALQEAHSKGIVHRDVKAENIMVTKNQAKVMDFGLAKLKGSLKLTKTSSTIGTLAYMAPEQIQGEEVDARSDIFSFGVVLFEMLTGRMPFKGEHEAAMMYSIMHELPDSLLKYRPDAPSDLERIIHRALEKEPEDRYQHVDDMVSELRRVQKQSTRVSRASLASTKIPETSQPPREAVSETPVPEKTRHTLLISGALVGVAVIAVAGYFLFFTTHKAIDSLAVLPFINASGDPNTEYLSDGITESLINGLSRLSNLSVMSRSSVFHYKGKDTDPQVAGKELGVKAVLAGRVTQRGENLIVSTELVDVSNNHHIWGDQYNRKLSDILSVQEEIAREISRNLSVTLSGEEEKKLTKRSTENVEAYQLYLKGIFYWNKRKADDLQKALGYFQQAIEKDPNYALAHAGLASTYVLLPEYAGVKPKDAVPMAEAAAKRATELDPTLAEAHAVLGLLLSSFRWDWDGAEREYKRAIELNPNYPTTYHWYCILLRTEGRFDQALATITRAQELDPLSLVIGWNVAEILTLMQRYDQAREQYRKMLELDPNFPGARIGLGWLHVQQGKYPEAIKEFQAVRQILGPDDSYGLEALGYMYAKSGKKEEAVKVLNHLLALSKQGSSVSVEIAVVYAALEEKEKAFEWLERGSDEKNPLIGYLRVDPEWENLRGDPRYAALLRKLGLDK
jgi:serine/threonine protein kinase/Flp pilus assembly protein TadD